MMKQYIFKLLWVAVPVMLIVLFPSWALYISGELKSLDKVTDEMIDARKHSENKLIGYGYQFCIKPYKRMMVQKLRPDIIALGTSRIMQFDEDWIDDSYSFYNAGGGAYSISRMIDFLQSLSYQPKLLIINLDQFFFSQRSLKNNDYDGYDYTYAPAHLLGTSIINLYTDLFDGKIVIDSLLHTHNIGMNAIMNHNGFCIDGTYNYGSVYTNPQLSLDYKFKDTRQRIVKGVDRFEWDNEIDTSILPDLEKLISFCDSMHTRLLVLLPPFAPAIWNQMKESGNYAYIDSIQGVLEPYNNGVNTDIFVYNDGDEVGSNNCEFVDGFHGSNKTYLRVLMHIINKQPSLSCYFQSYSVLSDILEEYGDMNVEK